VSYECHLTIPAPEIEAQRASYEHLAEQRGWKTSEIARDPLMGEETFFYFTKHADDYGEIFDAMFEMAEQVAALGTLVVRRKIEMIVYDVRVRD
jgi:hypothetical protein